MQKESNDKRDYTQEIEDRAEEVMRIMSSRTGSADMRRLRQAFEMAREAHAPQRRKTGEPYIFHPLAVAKIAAEELHLDVNSVIAAFLHDVVEDTPHSVEEISRTFGPDVAFLVGAVTKQKKEHYEMSKQLDNFKQMLDAMGHDIRAILVKLSDRLHNMRTLASMPAEKQMKIAGETDYFYAPLATRLGLYNIKSELENLSLRYRCPHEYAELTEQIEADRQFQSGRLARFREQIHDQLRSHGIVTRVFTDYRRPYSLWRKMLKSGDDFNHLKYRHFTEVVFDAPEGMTEKEMTLKIYSLLTDRFREKPGGIVNYIDSPKENGYQSFHLKLLADFGRWQEVHISSERMMRESQYGILLTDRSSADFNSWMEKFRVLLSDIRRNHPDANTFMESMAASFYNDDILVFSPKGRDVVLPQRSTVIDFAYEISPDLGRHAHYARINTQLASIKTPLHRGDIVEIFTSRDVHPNPDWLNHCVTYKARREIGEYLDHRRKSPYRRCPVCRPLPGEEVIGYSEKGDFQINVHKRDCRVAIRLASQYGDNIKSVDFHPDDTLYPVKISVRAVDRYHLFIDLVSCITDRLALSMHSFDTETADGIVTCHIALSVHSYKELEHIISHIAAINGVDEVKRIVEVED